ncbi:MAG TPA: DUF1570 domain-containing protein [Polyangiaceae bacterium]|nr:DUF1570 domain-containing protein [Polyangiaceae bacterium]
MTFKLWAIFGLLGGISTYDLPADVARRSAEARQELGGRATVSTVEDVFMLITPPNQGSLPGTVALTKQVLGAYFNGRFSKKPSQAISVYLFPDSAPYEAYCQKRWGAACGTPFGFYRPDERRIVMNAGPGIGTLTHELVHPIIETDFPEAPTWLNEGIASLFEALTLPAAGQIHGVKNWRHPRLLRALGSNTERDQASLPAVFAMSDAAFRGAGEDLHYASARYLCQWLDQKALLWPFYQRYRDHHAEDPAGAQSFLAVVGKTPAAANDDWVRWVKRL